MKKQISILILFTACIGFGVAAHPVTVKPHFATEFAVSKKVNEVVVNINFEKELVVYYNVSEVINYCHLVQPATVLLSQAEVLLADNKLITRNAIINNKLRQPIKIKKIYLLNCSIRQCSTGALIRSVN